MRNTPNVNQPDRPKAALLGSLRAARSGGGLIQTLECNLVRQAAILATVIPYVAFQQANGFFNGHLYALSPASFWAVDVFFNVLFPVVAVWLLKSQAAVHSKEYGFQFPPPLAGELLAASVFFGLLLFLVYFVPFHIAWRMSAHTPPSFSYGAVMPRGILAGPVVLYLSITAGLVESLMYIGLPWLLWRERLGGPSSKMLFTCLSSVVFALGHWEQGIGGIVGALSFGIAACALYFKVRDLWPIAGAHAAIDIAAFW